jgi:hypothetical protein
MSNLTDRCESPNFISSKTPSFGEFRWNYNSSRPIILPRNRTIAHWLGLKLAKITAEGRSAYFGLGYFEWFGVGVARNSPATSLHSFSHRLLKPTTMRFCSFEMAIRRTAIVQPSMRPNTAHLM